MNIILNGIPTHVTDMPSLIQIIVNMSQTQSVEVNFLHQKIIEPFNFAHQEIHHRLTFLQAKFENWVSFEHTKCRDNLEFYDCHFQNDETLESHVAWAGKEMMFLQINQFSHLEVGRDLVFGSSTVYGKCDFYKCEVIGYVRTFKHCIFGKLSMRRCVFGQLLFNEHTIVHGYFSLQDTVIHQRTELLGQYLGNIDLIRGTFKSHFDISKSCISKIVAAGACFEGTFLAIATQILGDTDFTTAQFKGISNFSNAIFAKGVRFLDSSFERNTFFSNTFLGPFSIFRRTSFNELLNFQVHPESSVVWESLLFQGMLELDRTLEGLPSFAHLKGVAVLDQFCSQIFVSWSNADKPPKVLPVSFCAPKYPKLPDQVKEAFLEKYPMLANHDWFEPSTNEVITVLLPSGKNVYEQYLITEIGNLLQKSPQYSIISKPGKQMMTLDMNSQVGNLPPAIEYEVHRLFEKWKSLDSERLYDAEAICGVLKMGYRAALNEDAEDWAFRKSRGFESEREGDFSLKLQAFAGYGTQPMRGLAYMTGLLFLLIGCRVAVGSLISDTLTLQENIFQTVKLFLAAENEIHSFSIFMSTIDVLISIIGLVSVTFWIIAMSHRVIRS